MLQQVIDILHSDDFTPQHAEEVKSLISNCAESLTIVEIDNLWKPFAARVDASFNSLTEYLNVLRDIKLRCDLLKVKVFPDAQKSTLFGIPQLIETANDVAGDCERLIAFIGEFVIRIAINEANISTIVPRVNCSVHHGNLVDEIGDLYAEWRDVSWIIEQCKIIIILGDVTAILIATTKKAKELAMLEKAEPVA